MAKVTLLDELDHGTFFVAGQTYRGMAHFAGTGPTNKTCRECQHWAGGASYYAKSNRDGARLKPAKCRKRVALMKGDCSGEGVPHYAMACKYFEANENPPSVFAEHNGHP